MNIFLFPGQGSQSVGMGKDLYEKYDQARSRFSAAAEILGFDLGEICFHGSADDLRQTIVTQPALYVHSCVLADLLREAGVLAAAAAGHSLGEYSALYAAGAFSFEDGLRFVKVRAEAMQRAGELNPGTMAAIIGLEEQEVRKLCDSVADVGIAVPANLNSPGQIVVSGAVPAIDKIIQTAKSFGARMAKRLEVSGAFHSPLMQPAADALESMLRTIDIRNPAFPVISNVTGEPHSQPNNIRELLTRQLLSPVRWTDDLYALARLGSANWYEVGSGNVLSGLLKRTIEGAIAINVDGADALNKLAFAEGASA